MSDRPSSIEQAHWQEWVDGSGVDGAIVALNVRSLSDPAEIDKLLNRNNSKRWKHGPYSPGWAVTGLEPSTGETTFLGCQFKPDEPPQRVEKGVLKFKKDGTPDLQKYLSASGYETDPLFLEAPGIDWREIIEDVSVPLVLTEGAKKAGAGLTIGFATVSLPGVGNGQKRGELKPRLAQFCRVGRIVTIGFDHDQVNNPNVQRELDRLGRLIAATGAIVKVGLFPEDAPKLDDHLVKYGADKTRDLIMSAISFELWRAEFYQPNLGDNHKSNEEKQSEDEAKRSAAAWMAETTSNDENVKFFQDERSREFYVSLPAKLSDPGGSRIVGVLHGPELESYLRLRFRQTHKKSAPMEAPKVAIADLVASLKYGELPYDSYPVGRRSLRINNNIFIDLADEGGHYVHISPGGWEVRLKDESCPVRFVSGSNLAPMPLPDRGNASLDAFDRWFEPKSQERAVALAWILCTYLGIPYFLLLLIGPPGSGKTTLAKVLLLVADPKPKGREMRTRPRESRDLATAAANSHVASFDNVTSLSQDLSDTLCVMLTGGSASERRMATNYVEASVELANPVLMTAVGNPITAPDLSSRTLIIELPPRDQNEDIEGELEDFQVALPQILATIFDALADGLAGEADVSSVGLGRQVKAYKVAIAAAESLGFNQEEMREHLLGSSEQVTTSVLESGLAQALIAFLSRCPQPLKEHWQELSPNTSIPCHYWTGSASELLLALGSGERPRPTWMKSTDPRWLGRELSQLTNALKQAGVFMTQLPRKSGGSRPHLITYTPLHDLSQSKEEGVSLGSDGNANPEEAQNPEQEGISATAMRLAKGDGPHGSNGTNDLSQNWPNPEQISLSTTAMTSPAHSSPVEEVSSPATHGKGHGSGHGNSHQTHGNSQNPYSERTSTEINDSTAKSAMTAMSNPPSALEGDEELLDVLDPNFEGDF